MAKTCFRSEATLLPAAVGRAAVVCVSREAGVTYSASSIREQILVRLSQEDAIATPGLIADCIWERIVRPVLVEQAANALTPLNGEDGTGSR